MSMALSTVQPLSPSYTSSDTPPHRSSESIGNDRRRSSQIRRLEDQGDLHAAIKRYKEMLIIHNGGSFSDLAFAPVLKACSKASALEPGKQIHAQSIKWGLSSDVFVQTSLLTMYSSCGQMGVAFELFDKMPHRNVVTWTALMDIFLQSGQPARAMFVFCDMQRTGIKPDGFAIVILLSACARLGALNLGRWVHSYVEKEGLGLTVFTGTALIDMYCKCGSIDDALLVFNSMFRKTVHSWNAMLHGLSVHGQGEKALQLFSEMERDARVHPNAVTFVAVLCGCSHCGLVIEGRHYFDLMQNKYGIEPTIKHYGCMVDLLGRAGLLDEAFEMIIKMHIPPNNVVWGSLLSACRAHNNVTMAEQVNQRIISIQEDIPQGDTSHHVMMSNMYARAGLKDKMAKTRVNIGKKPKGMSWIEIGSNVHEFAVGDVSNPMWSSIKVVLNEIMAKLGREYDKEECVEYLHSEMVAVAFGLLNTSAPMPVRIVKNLRICENCHNAMKFVSEVYQREIIIRDCTRFHRFTGGHCSCNDYW